MVFFGIDPGSSGAIAAVWDDGVPAGFIKTDKKTTLEEIAKFLRGYDLDNARAAIEKVHSSPQMGVKSAFSFGESYGSILGLFAGLQIPVEVVTPKKWQTEIGCLSGGDKNVTKARAQMLFPKVKVTHANADAYLIAEYGRRLNGKDS